MYIKNVINLASTGALQNNKNDIDSFGRWTVKAYAFARSGNVIDQWDAPSRAKAKLDQRLNYMKDRPAREWQYDYAHKLTDGEGIWEIKFEWGNIAYRPLFFLGPNQMEFTVVFMAQERGGRWRPPNSLAVAVAMMSEVLADPTKAVTYDDF